MNNKFHRRMATVTILLSGSFRLIECTKRGWNWDCIPPSNESNVCPTVLIPSLAKGNGNTYVHGK